MARYRRHGGEPRTGELVKKAIASSLARKLKEQPEALQAMIDHGLVDGTIVMGDEPNLEAMIRQFKDRIVELAQDEPSVMKRLEIRPLDLFVESEPAQIEASSPQRDSTVVFCDLEGFTTFTSERGDLEASALLKDHYEVVEGIVKSRGGRVIKTLGDGHMMSFSEPAAAVMAGVDLISCPPAQLRLRAGAHGGSVVVSENDLLGHVVNVAARVTGLATGGMSLVTTEVRDRAGRLPTVMFDTARSESVAGLDDPVEVCEAHAI